MRPEERDPAYLWDMLDAARPIGDFVEGVIPLVALLACLLQACEVDRATRPPSGTSKSVSTLALESPTLGDRRPCPMSPDKCSTALQPVWVQVIAVSTPNCKVGDGLVQSAVNGVTEAVNLWNQVGACRTTLTGNPFYAKAATSPYTGLVTPTQVSLATDILPGVDDADWAHLVALELWKQCLWIPITGKGFEEIRSFLQICVTGGAAQGLAMVVLGSCKDGDGKVTAASFKDGAVIHAFQGGPAIAVVADAAQFSQVSADGSPCFGASNKECAAWVLAHGIGHVLGAWDETHEDGGACACFDPAFRCAAAGMAQPAACTVDPEGQDVVGCAPEFPSSALSIMRAGKAVSWMTDGKKPRLSAAAACAMDWFEVCTGASPTTKDEDCDGVLDEDFGQGCSTYFQDLDGDTYYPGAPNSKCVCTVLADQQVPGFVSAVKGKPGDCDDNEKTSHPGGKEACDGKDNDCKNGVDDSPGPVMPGAERYCFDCDGDYWGPAQGDLPDGNEDNRCKWLCVLPGEEPGGADECYRTPQGAYNNALGCGGGATTPCDCDDKQQEVHPNAPEVIGNGIDDDCNAGTPDTCGAYYPDKDGDGHGVFGEKWTKSCVKKPGFVTSDDDCDDTNGNVFPGAAEVMLNGMDDDCDGLVDEGSDLCDPTEETYRPCTQPPAMCPRQSACLYDPVSPSLGRWSSCYVMPGFQPTLEVPDGKDNDCDGYVDNELGSVPCGLGACEHVVPLSMNGLEQKCDATQGKQDEEAPAVDSIDNDCDGDIDEDVKPCTKAGAIKGCEEFDKAGCTKGYRLCKCEIGGKNCHWSGCNLGSGGRWPEPEKCNGLDDDCDGVTDEGCGKTWCGLGNCRHKVELYVAADGVLESVNNCNPTQGWQPEVCDGKDNNCDGRTDEYCDTDSDGHCTPSLECKGFFAACPHGCNDCDDNEKKTHGGFDARELPTMPNQQARDEDCDGLTDEGFPNLDADMGDTASDVCDHDMDGDGKEDKILAACDEADAMCIAQDCPGYQAVEPGPDNCPRWSNSEQIDSDGDSQKGAPNTLSEKDKPSPDDVLVNKSYTRGGDACDLDDDNDGFYDERDTDGQLTTAVCTGGNTWKCFDNCPTVANGKGAGHSKNPYLSDQSDVNGDGLGDACQGDMDGDGIPNEKDNCPRWPNAPTKPNQPQADNDGDAEVDELEWNYRYPSSQGVAPMPPDYKGGDACDVDDDNDWVLDEDDNCPSDANGDPAHSKYKYEALQANHDGDSAGDACDTDDDNDTILDDGGGDGVPFSGFKFQADHDATFAPGGQCAVLKDIDACKIDQGEQCRNGNKAGCDDNCPWKPNPLQEDSDNDGNPIDDDTSRYDRYVGDEPCDFDDDNDGLSDDDEVRCGTDPKNPNSDGDKELEYRETDFEELFPGALFGGKYLDLYCCNKPERMAVDQTSGGREGPAQCMERLKAALEKEARRRWGSPDGKFFFEPRFGPPYFATDPLNANDNHEHSVLGSGGEKRGGCAVAGGGCCIGLLLLVTMLAIGFRLRAWPAVVALFLLVPVESRASEVQVIRPVGVGRGGFYTQTTDTLWKMDTAFGLVYEYLHRPVVVIGQKGAVDIVKSCQMMYVKAGLGLINRFEVDLELPLQIDRTIDPGYAEDLGQTAVGDLYLGFKYQIIQRTSRGIGLSASPFFLLSTGSESRLSGSGNQNFGLTIAVDRYFSFLLVAINAGVTRRLDGGFLYREFSKRLHSTFDYGALVQAELFRGRLNLFLDAAGGVELTGGEREKPFQLAAGLRLPMGILDFSAGYARGFTGGLSMPAHLVFVGVGFYKWPEAGGKGN